MYLIYVDDYGNTGDRLDDPDQPLFSLHASFVATQSGGWNYLEREIMEVMREVQALARAYDLPPPERVHMVDLYQRKGKVYRQISIDQTFAWIERILEAMRHAEVLHRHIIMDKPMIRAGQAVRHSTGEYANVHEQRTCQTKGPNFFPAPLYDATLPRLLWEIDLSLQELDAYGMVFLDQQQGYESLEKLNVYRVLRHHGMLKRLLEAPIYRDGRFNTMLAVPDIAGFITVGLEADQLHVPPKRRPKLEEWHDEYVLPFGAPTTMPGWFQATRESEFMTGMFDNFRKANDFHVIEAMDYLSFSILKAMPKTYKPPSENGGLS
ncbi:DUF3800 domain-containing protein [Deinococcus marmoris]|uniref:DUF3800 domain-containing protein n=1 Tax=Deinococcus marmoris TaxID=249408 RepID=UPI00049711E1|nr:DUF3800 domain-containing protein [Deinococcus marmoris]